MDTNSIFAHKFKRREDLFRPWLVEGASFSGKYEIPCLNPCLAIPDKAIHFDKAFRTNGFDQWVHFYLEDERFERIWNRPKVYVSRLSQFDGVISPDFSLYRDMPLVMQLWNTYRGRAIGFYLQKNGMQVIPNVRWSDARSYEFCFDGIPAHAAVSVSNLGCLHNKVDRSMFKSGFNEMLSKIKPYIIIVYGRMPIDIFEQYSDCNFRLVNLPYYNDIIRKAMN